MQDRTKVGKWANRQREKVRPIVGAQVRGPACLGVEQRQQPVDRARQGFERLPRPGPLLPAQKGIHPQRHLKHQALVVGAVLGVLAITVDLGLKAFVEPSPAQETPRLRRGMPCQRQPGGVETGGLGQQVIVALGTGVYKRGRDARRVGGDRLSQPPQPFRRRGGRPGEDLPRPDQDHQPDGDLLARDPLRAEIRRVGIQKGFGVAPECLGVFFVSTCMKGAAEGERPAKAGRLPDEFDVRDLRIQRRE